MGADASPSTEYEPNSDVTVLKKERAITRLENGPDVTVCSKLFHF